MEYIGSHYGFKTYYLDLGREDYYKNLPTKDWICFLISNEDFDDSPNSKITKFIRSTIAHDLLTFIGQGNFGGMLHLTFDLEMVKMEVDEGHSKLEIMTMGNNDGDLANGFWDCFGASCLPERADYDNVKVICATFDTSNYKKELEDLLVKFNEGWLPD